MGDRADNALYFRLYRKPSLPDKEEEADTILMHIPESESALFDGGTLSIIDNKLTQPKIIKRNLRSAKNYPLTQSSANVTILSVAPQHPSKMVEIAGRDERDIHFALEGDVGPLVVNFIIHRKNSTEMPLADKNDLMGGRLMQCQFEDMGFDLLITLAKIPDSPEGEKVSWPPHSIVLKRIGYQQ